MKRVISNDIKTSSFYNQAADGIKGRLILYVKSFKKIPAFFKPKYRAPVSQILP